MFRELSWEGAEACLARSQRANKYKYMRSRYLLKGYKIKNELSKTKLYRAFKPWEGVWILF